MNQQKIAKILTEWWRAEETCSGKPHCCIDECDLCINCFQELCAKFGCKWNLNNRGDEVFIEKDE